MIDGKIAERLGRFLLKNDNTVTRERLLFHRFCFDTCLAAARDDCALAVLSIEVDREGFDVVLDDGDRERRIQLKVVGGTTASWSVPKRLLRPQDRIGSRLGFKETQEGIGAGGAIVVMEYDPAAWDLDVKYLCCDAHILAARANGWITADGRPGNRNELAETKILDLQTGSGSEQISVPRSLLVKARTPDHLLALLELRSIQGRDWCEMLRARLSTQYSFSTHGPMENLISGNISSLVSS